MAIERARFFSPDPSSARSLKGLDVRSLFNDTMLGEVNALMPQDAEEDLDGEDAAAEERQYDFDRLDEQRSFTQQQEDDAFLAAGGPQVNRPGAQREFAAREGVAPAEPSAGPRESMTNYSDDPAPSRGSKGSKGTIKLANYGYDSDSSPDYNSNVLKIGHANNKLEDGVSAAVTKSLARRHGLKTGDMFQITTADGKTMTRRYDDTVPTTYKGKALPETVDLYERKGSNNFGGKVVEIKPLKQNGH